MTSHEISTSSPSGLDSTSQSEATAASALDPLSLDPLSNEFPGGSAAEVALIRTLAEQLALPLSAEQEQVVCQNWMFLATITQPLMQLDLPQNIEPAPRFEP